MRERLLALVAEWESQAEELRHPTIGNSKVQALVTRLTLLDCIDDVNELLREAEREHQI